MHQREKRDNFFLFIFHFSWTVELYVNCSPVENSQDRSTRFCGCGGHYTYLLIIFHPVKFLLIYTLYIGHLGWHVTGTLRWKGNKQYTFTMRFDLIVVFLEGNVYACTRTIYVCYVQHLKKSKPLICVYILQNML